MSLWWDPLYLFYFFKFISSWNFFFLVHIPYRSKVNNCSVSWPTAAKTLLNLSSVIYFEFELALGSDWPLFEIRAKHTFSCRIMWNTLKEYWRLAYVYLSVYRVFVRSSHAVLYPFPSRSSSFSLCQFKLGYTDKHTHLLDFGSSVTFRESCT